MKVKLVFLFKLCFSKGEMAASSAEGAQVHDRSESVLGRVIQTRQEHLFCSKVGYNCRALQCSVMVYFWQSEQSSGFLQLFLLLRFFLANNPSFGDGLMMKALA